MRTKDITSTVAIFIALMLFFAGFGLLFSAFYSFYLGDVGTGLSRCCGSMIALFFGGAMSDKI